MVRMRSRFRCALLAAVAIGTMMPVAPACAQEQRRIEYSIEFGDLGEALKTVSRLSGKEILFNSDTVLGKRAMRLRGTYSADDAVRALLKDTGLTAQYRRDVIIIRGRNEPSSEVADRSADQNEIVVTGTHIRGSEPVSPVIVVSRSAIEQRGITDLGAFGRDLVQNYSGGQNPGVGGGGQGGSENVTSASALNLRGLGPDATLTLVNGHRVSYDALGQGVDISAIPLAAVDRVEVVTDGSSALYGSDAVGGVANVILRRDYDRVVASARLGAATDGGDEEQQYNLVAGNRWQAGGIMAAFDYRRSTPISAGQRSYTQNLFPTALLVTGQRQYSAVVAGHQELTDGLNSRWMVISMTGRAGIASFSRQQPTAPCQVTTSPSFQDHGLSPLRSRSKPPIAGSSDWPEQSAKARPTSGVICTWTALHMRASAMSISIG